MSHNNLQIIILLLLDTSVGMLVGWSTSTVNFPLLQLLIYVLTVLTDWIKRLEKHVLIVYLWSSRCCRRLRQINCEIWNHQWSSDVIRLQLGWFEIVVTILKVRTRRWLFQILLLFWSTVHINALSWVLLMLLLSGKVMAFSTLWAYYNIWSVR